MKNCTNPSCTCDKNKNGCECGGCENCSKQSESSIPEHTWDVALLTPATQYMYNPVSERNNNKSLALSKRKIRFG